MKCISILALGLALSLSTWADDQKDEKTKVDYHPEVHGTVRGKYEYQPEINSGRFQVRNARVSIEGKVAPVVAYKAEIDLSDEGQIKMLDAYTQITPLKNFDFTIGQMRVPFTIDAHRSPHQQYFANRSFIAKQVGNVRDVGATLEYTVDCALPIILQGGVFNGSGLTNQADFWTKHINYSVKMQFTLPKDFHLVLSTQKIKPEHVSINMYDAGVNYQAGRWMVEAEYLYKHYNHNAFQDVNAFDGFVCYDLPLKKVFHKISFLGRFDYMSDHSDGTSDENGALKLTDAERKRITAGITLSIAKPFISDLRLNYEKYFYRAGATPLPSERDKFVVEVMTRF
ncbi:MAG: OprO/OprP family phosphate-selective porin [Paraprevotella sp.]|nr:OprO/OprP family phosphate-selective porin [Paraprevotella sp.]